MTKKKDPNEKLPTGRPTCYRAWFNDLAYKYTLLGAIDKELAVFFGVSEKTLNTWKQNHPEFLQSIKLGKIIADGNVAHSLYQRAIGYMHSENKIFQYKGEAVIVPTTKHYPPDTQAASLWLRNRQPALWRDRTELVLPKGEFDDLTGPELVKKLAELQAELKILEQQL